ncbi:hypothetical protein JMJ77_0005202 [Colletotrichum scovillei]|uniref:Uncharacterized protein n=1 Tax=Colletotrichum scovillei TaxID=1209932 RepID=A0A9P7UHY1_9PEZI|nr:hypothetical protein JMJ77_0005202 [Colletotrichum scovillei]KAG7076417.1 hypothetical protein JMJ76_0013682 [Colletotrichum scovillei]KAG7083577.1 hypothetical protein JMJ78_0009022 [Colletotrichum scovillei]
MSWIASLASTSNVVPIVYGQLHGIRYLTVYSGQRSISSVVEAIKLGSLVATSGSCSVTVDTKLY